MSLLTEAMGYLLPISLPRIISPVSTSPIRYALAVMSNLFLEFFNEYPSFLRVSTMEAEQEPFEHIDLLISGIVGQDRIPILFIDDFFNRAVNRSLSKSFPRVRFIPVAHERVLQGALNIKHLDGKALVTTREIVGEEVINNLEQNGIPIVELGADQFDYYGGPKGRSLDIEWRIP